MKKIVALAMVATLFLTACSQSASNPQSGGNSASGQPNVSAPAQSTPETSKSNYPVKNIEMVVPFAAGGSTDINARLLAAAVQKQLPDGVNIVVVNTAGGGSTIGTADVVSANPDGYKVLMTSTAPLTIAPHQGTTTYQYDDLIPILRVCQASQMLVVRSDSQWNNYDEWMEYVKANPGKFTYGIAGIGTTSHLVMENLNMEAGVETTVVPFASSAESQTAVLGGNVDGFVVSFLAPNDELRPLFSFGMESPMYDIPTLPSKGFSEINQTFGIFVPKGTPDDVQQYLHDVFKTALDDPDLITGYENSGVYVSYGDSETFAAQLETENTSFGAVMEKIGLAG